MTGDLIDETTFRVMRSLALSGAPRFVLSKPSGGSSPLTHEQLASILRDARELTLTAPLLPEAIAGYVSRTDLTHLTQSGAPIGLEDVAGLRELGLDALDSCLAICGRTDAEPDGWSTPRIVAGLEYVEAVVLQRATMNVTSAGIAQSALQLGPDDRARLTQLVVFINLQNRTLQHLDGLLARWQRFATQMVELPDGWGTEEISLRLFGRDHLQDIVEVLSPQGQRSCVAELAPYDELFIRATEPLPRPFARDAIWRPRRWWWYRLPGYLHDEAAQRWAWADRR